MFIEIKCAWCGVFMGNKECEGQIDKAYRISHSICPECKARVEIETENFLKKTANKFKMKGEKYE